MYVDSDRQLYESKRLNRVENEEKTGCVGVTLWANRENQNMDCLLAIMAG